MSDARPAVPFDRRGFDHTTIHLVYELEKLLQNLETKHLDQNNIQGAELVQEMLDHLDRIVV